VEGSVRKAGDRLRISAQLIDATTGGHLWAERYDRELRDIFEVQDEITQAIVGSMHPELKRSEMQRAVRDEPQHLDAWDCVMRGWWHRSQFTREDNLAAQRCFERAIELDPQSSEAFAGVAYSHANQMLEQGTGDIQQSIANLTQAARRSVELDPNNPSAQIVLGIAARFAGRTREAIAAARQALELNPSDWRAYAEVVVSLAQTGAAEEALEYVERGMRLSPRDPMIWVFLQNASLAYFGAKRYEEAVDLARRLVQAYPKLSLNWRILASCCAHLGRLDEARSALEEMFRLQPEYSLAIARAALAAADADFRERYIDGLRKAGLKE
jgi:adenylate cyclase